VVADLLAVPARADAKMTRPAETRSRLATCLAVMIGSRWTSSATPVASRILSVTAAMALRVTKGSRVR
jgi:hypothetical protein